MERLKAKTTDVQQAISRPPSDSLSDTEKVISGWVILCAQHFRVEVNEADIAIYVHALRGTEPDRLDTAFQRCLKECEFMPKLVDVCNRLPEAQEPQKLRASIEDFVKEPQTWTEEYGGCSVSYTGDPKGVRFVVRAEWK